MVKGKLIMKLMRCFITIFTVLLFSYSFAQNNNQIKPKVTFIELGSDKCIPCKQMQPILKSIEKKYGSQIKVIFYDVWKDDKPAKKYGIQLIPTQVFLDETGKEFFRHEGFYPEAEIDKLLQKKGLKTIAE